MGWGTSGDPDGKECTGSAGGGGNDSSGWTRLANLISAALVFLPLYLCIRSVSIDPTDELEELDELAAFTTTIGATSGRRHRNALHRGVGHAEHAEHTKHILVN